MNKLIRAEPKRCFERPGRRAKRRRRRGENVAPAEASQVERREAPHPYVIGVRAPSQGSPGVPRKHPGASRRSISLARKGEGKMGTGGARRPKIQRTGRRSVVYLLFDK